MRRKKKIVHKAASADDKKLQSQLKKLSVNPIPGIEEVNMFKDDGTILNFSNPKVPCLIPNLIRYPVRTGLSGGKMPVHS